MSKPAPGQAFPGYQIAQANFVQLPTEILWDTRDLAPELHHTLVCAAGKILWEQFRAGMARDTLVPIPLAWWMETLGLTRNAVKTRLARLEELGRLVIQANPDPHAGNFYGIRWASKRRVTTFHAYRIARRSSEITRLKEARATPPGQPTDQGEGGQPTDPPSRSADRLPPRSADEPPVSKKVEDTDLKNLDPSVRQSSGATTGEETPTDGQIRGLFRQEGETLLPVVVQALKDRLDPPQVARLQASSIFGSRGLWALLEAIRVHGAKLNKPAAVLWGGTQDPQKAEAWILRVLGPLEEAGWFEQVEDGTAKAPLARLQVLKRLGALALMPLDAEGQNARAALLAEERRRDEAFAQTFLHQAEADEPEDEQEEEAPAPPPAPPKPAPGIPVAEFPPEALQALRGLITEYRQADRKAWFAPREEREAFLELSKAAWARLVEALASIGPRLRAGGVDFTSTDPNRANINDLEKELSRD